MISKLERACCFARYVKSAFPTSGSTQIYWWQWPQLDSLQHNFWSILRVPLDNNNAGRDTQLRSVHHSPPPTYIRHKVKLFSTKYRGSYSCLLPKQNQMIIRISVFRNFMDKVQQVLRYHTSNKHLNICIQLGLFEIWIPFAIYQNGFKWF